VCAVHPRTLIAMTALRSRCDDSHIVSLRRGKVLALDAIENTARTPPYGAGGLPDQCRRKDSPYLNPANGPRC